MTSSGTYAFSASNGEIVLAAYERIRIRLPSLRQEHFVSARKELNFLQSQFSNLQPNLWEVELVPVTMAAGTATYDVDAKVVMILDAYITLNNGETNQTDRYITPLSRTDYASIAAKFTTGPPTSYWFDRLINPTITMYPVPDTGGPYTLNYYACTQIQDVALTSGQTPDIPYLWLDAMVAGLAHRLARIYAPDLEQIRKTDAKEAWDIAATQNIENTPLLISPNIGRYYR